MNEVIAAHAPRFGRLWDRIEARVAAYPGPLRALAEVHFARIGAAGRTYFTDEAAAPLVLLPCMAAGAPDSRVVAEAVLDAILEGAALAYFHVRIQDDVLDDPDERGVPDLLLLANAYLWDAMTLWRESAPRGGAGQAFHAASRDAWMRFSAETAAERVFLQRRAAYPAAAFHAHAGKVALAEVPLLAVRAHRVDGDLAATEVRALVHALGLAYGHMNDVVGHARDLRSGANTYLLATVRAALGDAQAPDAAVVGALATGSWLDRFVIEAMAAHEAARPLARALDLQDFDAWTDGRVASLDRMRQRLALLRLRAALDV